MNFINFISMCIGYSVIVIIILSLFNFIISFINTKIKDIRDRKTVIKEGTVLFKGDKEFVIKKDLNIRFKNIKGMCCTCDELNHKGWIMGNSFTKSKEVTLRNFEDELIANCISDPFRMTSVIREQVKVNSK